MATVSNLRSVTATLSTTTVDNARLLQPWDYVRVTNLDGTNALTLTDDGATDPVSGAEGTVLVPPSESRVFAARQLTTATPDGSAVICHEIRVLGNGGTYVVEGLPFQ